MIFHGLVEYAHNKIVEGWFDLTKQFSVNSLKY